MLIGKKRTEAKLFILTLAHKVGENGITIDFVRQKLQERLNEKPMFSIYMILNEFLHLGFLESSRESMEEKYTITQEGKLYRISLIKQLEKEPHDRGDGSGGGIVSPAR